MLHTEFAQDFRRRTKHTSHWAAIRTQHYAVETWLATALRIAKAIESHKRRRGESGVEWPAVRLRPRLLRPTHDAASATTQHNKSRFITIDLDKTRLRLAENINYQSTTASGTQQTLKASLTSRKVTQRATASKFRDFKTLSHSHSSILLQLDIQQTWLKNHKT